ncbi:D-glycero-alpha-D-manno-heptose-1,7-bisphosphate 7-phosphatase [Bordetella petrii]|uniref:D-glycero-alpha-D-manno-heptose-1,7-bisphosphate 7-phosphatase n=1 Tax=Bordetella petrii TaxID=94624 RepID=UPI001A95A438|nr:HAD-IIIA family hydrolase [Bordetella petrii]MBO1113768.1 HAD-IIIA family hydrolase [Bordetella petrii]
MALSPAVFLDKDGTVLADEPYNVDPARMAYAAGAREGLRVLAAAGVPLIVISNQPGVARGRFAPQALAGVEARLGAMFGAAGARLAGFYWCPHDPRGSVAAYAYACACRKPRPGLLLQAAREHGIDLARSWFIGDILDDVEAGNRAGCRTVLLDVGSETEWRPGRWRAPTASMPDLGRAAHHVVRAMRGEGREAA